MNILAIAPYTYNTPHYEIQLELLQLHMDAGDEITFMGCNAQMPVCDVNWKNETNRCMACISKRTAGFKLLSDKVKFAEIIDLSEQDRKDMQKLRYDITDLQEMLEYKFDGWDLGNGVVSSLVSWVRNPEPDLKAYGPMIKGMMQSAFMVHRSVKRYFQANKVDRVYLFNGRFAPLRAVLRACTDVGVDCYIHEISGSSKEYALYENSTPHDLVAVEQQMVRMWDAADPEERARIGAVFYEQRAHSGGKIAERNYIKDQKSGLLPEGWDESMHNIVIYNSSEDEYVAVSNQWDNPLYASQMEALNRIVDSLRAKPIANTRFWLRAHPHLKGKKNAWIDALFALDPNYITIIKPEEPIHSYDLMKAADKVLTFSSTVGIEAAYFKTVSVSAAPSYYGNLGSTWNPKSHEELMEMLAADLEPKDITGALIYGYYQNAKGRQYKYYKPNGLWDGEFKGVRVQQQPRMYHLGQWFQKVPMLDGLFGKAVLNHLIKQDRKVVKS